jgi:hypothetical protein
MNYRGCAYTAFLTPCFYDFVPEEPIIDVLLQYTCGMAAFQPAAATIWKGQWLPPTVSKQKKRLGVTVVGQQ